MKLLVRCGEKLSKLLKPHELDRIYADSADYSKEGVAVPEAEKRAVRDNLADIEQNIKAAHEQIGKAHPELLHHALKLTGDFHETQRAQETPAPAETGPRAPGHEAPAPASAPEPRSPGLDAAPQHPEPQRHTPESASATVADEIQKYGPKHSGLIARASNPGEAVRDGGIQISRDKYDIVHDPETLSAHANDIDKRGGEGEAWMRSATQEEAIHHSSLARMAASGMDFNATNKGWWKDVPESLKKEVKAVYTGENDPAALMEELDRMAYQVMHFGKMTEDFIPGVDTTALKRELANWNIPPEVAYHLASIDDAMHGVAKPEAATVAAAPPELAKSQNETLVRGPPESEAVEAPSPPVALGAARPRQPLFTPERAAAMATDQLRAAAFQPRVHKEDVLTIRNELANRGELLGEKPAAAIPAAPAPDLRAAYDRVAARAGTRAVSIAAVAKESGKPLAEVKQGLLEAHQKGEVVLSLGDWSLSSEEKRAGAIDTPAQKGNLLVRFISPETLGARSPKGGTGQKFTSKVFSREAPVTKSPEDRIEQAYRELAAGKRHGEVRVKDIANALPDLPRSQGVAMTPEGVFRHPEGTLDAGFEKLVRSGRASMRQVDDSLALTEEDHAKSFQMGGSPRHLISFAPQTLGALSPRARIREAVDKVTQEAAAFREELKAGDLKHQVSQGFDATGNIAHLMGRQAENSIRHDFVENAPPNETRAQRKARERQNAKDLVAARPVVESGGDRNEIIAGKAKALLSKDAKLGAKWAAVADHALARFDEINAKTPAHRKLAEDTYDQLHAAGEDFGKRENYVKRVVRPPIAPGAIPARPLDMGAGAYGTPKGFEKGRMFHSIWDDVQAGYDPGDYGIHEADGRMVEDAQRIIGGKAFLRSYESIPAPIDGKPIIGQLQQVTTASGQKEMRVPPGYQVLNIGGVSKVMHKQFYDLFQNLYGSSAIRASVGGRALLKFAAHVKAYTLVGDTFHAGRVMYKMFFTGGGGPLRMGEHGPEWNVKKGLALAEYTDADLPRAVAAKEITQSDADYARKYRPLFNELSAAGLNMGRVADNLMEQAQVHVPGMGGLNNFIFQYLSRGSLVQSALAMADKNLDSGIFATREDAIRQTVKEANEIFGNLQNQGLFKSKTLQDMARIALLAPNWAESQARAEGRSYGQAGKAGYRFARSGGRQRYVGNAARAAALGFVALLAVNQLINYLTRGHSTFLNPEDGHTLDAWIPGGRRGFWFNPAEISGEYAHAFMKYLAQGENPVDVAGHIVSNKLSPLTRAAKEAITGRDSSGRHFLSNTDRFRAALTDALPSPIPLSPFLEKDPRAPLGYRETRAPGALERQALQSVGAKVTPAQSPRIQMFALAQPFRADRGQTDNAGEYTELRRALDNRDIDSAKSEIQWLHGQGKDNSSIAHALGIKNDNSIAPERFAGGADAEQAFVKSLSPAHLQVYREAQADHIESAKLFQSIAGPIQPKRHPMFAKPPPPVFTTR